MRPAAPVQEWLPMVNQPKLGHKQNPLGMPVAEWNRGALPDYEPVSQQGVQCLTEVIHLMRTTWGEAPLPYQDSASVYWLPSHVCSETQTFVS